MLKRVLIILSLSLTLVVAAEPLTTVHGVLLSDEERAAVQTAGESTTAIAPKAKDNGFVRALKAPFKALGRLFGRKQKEPERIQGISQQDIDRFTHSPVNEVRINPSQQTNPDSTVEGNKASALAALQKGRELLASQNLNEALLELSRATSIDPTLAEAHSLIGVVYERKGLGNLARESFEEAVNVAKEDAQHLNNLGYLLYKQGDYKNATKLLKRAAKIQPDNPTIWNNLGLAQFERGKFDDAYKSFVRASGEFQGRLNIAKRLEAEGLTDDAIKHLEKARVMHAGSIQVLDQLIRLYERAGRNEQAATARTSWRAFGTMATAPSTAPNPTE